MSNRAAHRAAVASLQDLADDARELGRRGYSDGDWMTAANAESAIALSELAAAAADDLNCRPPSVRNWTQGSKAQSSADDLKAPLLAAIGVADLALERVNEIVATLRERADEVQSSAETRVEASRARLTRLQEYLSTQFGGLGERLDSEELRKIVESYAEAAQASYELFIERGEAAFERLGSVGEPADRVERYSDQVIQLAQEALGNVSEQAGAVGERTAKLVGVELTKKAQKSGTPIKKAAKKAPRKTAVKTATTRRTRQS